MSNKVKAILAVSALLTAFAFGRYSVPKSIKTNETEKKTTSNNKESQRDRSRKIVKKKVTKPDGTVTEITKEVDVSKDSKKSGKTVVEDKSKSSEIIKSSGLLTIEGLVGVNVTSPERAVYGLHISRDVIGPIRLGLFGFTSGVTGVSIGVGF